MTKLLACAFILIFVVSTLAPSNASFAAGKASTSAQGGPVFIWLFGYTGNHFLPQTQLNITRNQTIVAAQQISAFVGNKSRVNLVSIVGEEPNQPPYGLTLVNWHNAKQINTLKTYVSNLSQYASGLYARLDFQQFNATKKNGRSLFTEVSNFTTKVGINGFWLDHGPNIYNAMGQKSFNQMMQKLTTEFPNDTFIINDAVKCPNGMSTALCNKSGHGWVTPLSSDTWQTHTYVSATIQSNTYNKVNFNALTALSKIWGCSNCKGLGVLEHFDAYAQAITEPMGIFASQNNTMEIAAIQNLTNYGNPNSTSYNGYYPYSMIYPILGAATYKTNLPGSNQSYFGTLYDSLTVGTYARGTMGYFINCTVAAFLNCTT